MPAFAFNLVSQAEILMSFADSEVPSGSINGSNTTFTLAHAPNPQGSLILVLNGATLKGGGVDYTLVTTTLAMTVAPPTGSIFIAWYRY